MKKRIVFLAVLAIVALSVLLSLIRHSEKTDEVKNGFTRQWLAASPTVDAEQPLSEPLYKICGATEHSYFFTGKDPRKVILTNHQLIPYDTIFIPIKLTSKITAAYDIIVDSPTVTLFAYNLAAILRYNINDTTVEQTRMETPLFTRATPVSAQSLVLKGIDTLLKKQVFQKADNYTGKISLKKDLLQESHDAGFSTDGLLKYDTSTHRIVYVQLYQNKILCLDTNLNLLYQAKTIDTSNVSKLQTRSFAEPGKPGSLMSSAPIKLVNKNCFTGGGNLYVVSNVRADNEHIDNFQANAVIDVYSVDNGAYKGSFYLPNMNGKKPLAYTLFKTKLLALYPGKMVTFNLTI